MGELKIVASIIVKEAYKEELVAVFKYVVDETRKEAGNISYDLYEDVQNPLKFVILETWKDQQAIDFHNATDHFKQLLSATDAKVDSLTVDVLQKKY